MAGYNLDIFDNQNERPYTNDGSVNLAHLLVGSEGTLAFTKDLTLKLVPLPKNKVLGVVNFTSFHAAMDCAQHIVKLGPSAVELVDRIMIELALSNPAFRPTMETALIGKPEAILLVEFAGEDKPALVKKLKDLVALMGDLGLPGSVVEMEADAPQKNLWEVRKAGLNIMMSLKGDGKARQLHRGLRRAAGASGRIHRGADRGVHPPRHPWHLVCPCLRRHAACAPDPGHAPRRGRPRCAASPRKPAPWCANTKAPSAASMATGCAAANGWNGSSGPGINEAFRAIKQQMDPDRAVQPQPDHRSAAHG